MTTTLDRLQNLEQERKVLLQQLDNERARKRFVCACCTKMHAIKDCVVIQTMWYTPPSGCTGGDYWNTGELQIICPDLDTKQRVHFDSEYKVDYWCRNQFAYNAGMQFSRLYRHLFKLSVVSHKGQNDEDTRAWVNTQYFDQNRKRFGLHVKGLDK